MSFTRSMFNAAFKTNPYLERAIMTGVTRVSRESIFSDLNNLKVIRYEKFGEDEEAGDPDYELCLTNREVRQMFRTMVKGWFRKSRGEYNGFIKALLAADVKAMNYYMNKVALVTFSSFDVGRNPSEVTEPERFYHGFVLGLLVELSDCYIITSNRESGFGRYDVMMEPKCEGDGIILEFKVQDVEEEKELADTVKTALCQIEEREYEALLVSKGIPKEKIRKYGFAFCGKKVLIGRGEKRT